MDLLSRIFVFIILLFLSTSCIRKSGKKNIYTQSSEISNSNLSSRKSDKAEVPLLPKSNSKMTGSEIFEKYNSAVFMVFTSDGIKGYQGSGFFISPTGIAVSNYHVFEGTTVGYEQIKLSDNRIYKIKNVIVKSKEDDFIIFEVESLGVNFNYIPIGKNQPKVGETVFAIGSPRGLENTFSSGEISQLRDNNQIQINVPIDHGSSGGALINEYGHVIGITTSGLDYSGANLNFAVNINVLKPFL